MSEVGIEEMQKWIYFVCNEDYSHVKIGKSGTRKGCYARCGDLQVGNHQHLILVGIIAPMRHLGEQYIHTRFSKHRHRGEWFVFSGEIGEFIQRNSERIVKPSFISDGGVIELVESNDGTKELAA